MPFKTLYHAARRLSKCILLRAEACRRRDVICCRSGNLLWLTRMKRRLNLREGDGALWGAFLANRISCSSLGRLCMTDAPPVVNHWFLLFVCRTLSSVTKEGVRLRNPQSLSERMSGSSESLPLSFCRSFSADAKWTEQVSPQVRRLDKQPLRRSELIILSWQVQLESCSQRSVLVVRQEGSPLPSWSTSLSSSEAERSKSGSKCGSWSGLSAASVLTSPVLRGHWWVGSLR